MVVPWSLPRPNQLPVGTIEGELLELSCEDLRDEIASLEADPYRSFHELERLNRLRRVLEEREREGLC